MSSVFRFDSARIHVEVFELEELLDVGEVALGNGPVVNTLLEAHHRLQKLGRRTHHRLVRVRVRVRVRVGARVRVHAHHRIEELGRRTHHRLGRLGLGMGLGLGLGLGSGLKPIIISRNLGGGLIIAWLGLGFGFGFGLVLGSHLHLSCVPACVELID